MHETQGWFRPQDRPTVPPPADGYGERFTGTFAPPTGLGTAPGYGPGYGPGAVPGPYAPAGFPAADRPWEFEEDLAQLLQDVAEEPGWPAGPPEAAAAPAPVRRGAPRRHRRSRLAWLNKLSSVPWLRLLSLVMAALTAVIVAMLSVLGGTVAYNPLRLLAGTGTSPGLAAWWPLLVYGPWLVASLSILRAALHHRRSGHSWAVVLLFSAIAVVLCIAHAPKTLPGVSVASLPPITALVSFHQLVRQITLTSPTRRSGRRRRTASGRT